MRTTDAVERTLLNGWQLRKSNPALEAAGDPPLSFRAKFLQCFVVPCKALGQLKVSTATPRESTPHKRVMDGFHPSNPVKVLGFEDNRVLHPRVVKRLRRPVGNQFLGRAKPGQNEYARW